MKKLVTLPKQEWDNLRDKGYFIPKNDFDINKVKKPINFVSFVKNLDDKGSKVLLGLLCEHYLKCSALDIMKMATSLEEDHPDEIGNSLGGKRLEEIGEFYWERQMFKHVPERQLKKVLEIPDQIEEKETTSQEKVTI